MKEPPNLTKFLIGKELIGTHSAWLLLLVGGERMYLNHPLAGVARTNLRGFPQHKAQRRFYVPLQSCELRPWVTTSSTCQWVRPCVFSFFLSWKCFVVVSLFVLFFKKIKHNLKQRLSHWSWTKPTNRRIRVSRECKGVRDPLVTHSGVP